MTYSCRQVLMGISGVFKRAVNNLKTAHGSTGVLHPEDVALLVTVMDSWKKIF